MKLIKIKGVSNPSNFDDYVSSTLVDIVYFEGVKDGVVILSVEDFINLDKEKDRKWITDLINEGLLECKELSAKIAFE